MWTFGSPNEASGLNVVVGYIYGPFEGGTGQDQASRAFRQTSLSFVENFKHYFSSVCDEYNCAVV